MSDAAPPATCALLQSGEHPSVRDWVTRVARHYGVTDGWLRVVGAIDSVELSLPHAGKNGQPTVVRVQGPFQLVSADIVVAAGHMRRMHAVLARWGDTGAEMLAGEVIAARMVEADATLVSPSSDDSAHRVPEPRAVTSRRDASSVESAPGGRDGDRAAVPSSTAATEVRALDPSNPWHAAVAASEAASEPRGRGAETSGGELRSATRAAGGGGPSGSAAGGFGSMAPPRPIRRHSDDDDAPYPEAGAHVEHFAFGSGEVLKSDGDRLHVKVAKDGRIREIVLQILKVTPLAPGDDGRPRFRLDRKL